MISFIPQIEECHSVVTWKAVGEIVEMELYSNVSELGIQWPWTAIGFSKTGKMVTFSNAAYNELNASFRDRFSMNIK